jgi:hypothetical protein
VQFCHCCPVCLTGGLHACGKGPHTRTLLLQSRCAASAAWLVVQYAQLECPWQANCTQGRGEGGGQPIRPATSGLP